MTTYTEFNRDIFLCNLVNDSPECSDVTINTTCNTKDLNCEICKNFKYRDWYDTNNSKNIYLLANHDDSKHEYFRTWIQTCNLGIGIIFLCIGIYYQQSE
jgi:hypothetical protein